MPNIELSKEDLEKFRTFCSLSNYGFIWYTNLLERGHQRSQEDYEQVYRKFIELNSFMGKLHTTLKKGIINA